MLSGDCDFGNYGCNNHGRDSIREFFAIVVSAGMVAAVLQAGLIWLQYL